MVDDEVEDRAVEALFCIGDGKNTGSSGSSDNGELFNIYPSKSAKLTVKMNDTPMPVLIDSGACSNLMDKYTKQMKR